MPDPLPPSTLSPAMPSPEPPPTSTVTPPSWQRRVTTLVYAFDGAGRLCLLHRRQAPNRDLWSPPGGKIEADETPLAGALRELEEETGLLGVAPRLVAVVTEHDRPTGEAWLMFIVRVDVPDPTLGGDGREGDAAWVAAPDIARLPTPPADGHILAVVHEADGRHGVAFMDVRYANGELSSVTTVWAP